MKSKVYGTLLAFGALVLSAVPALAHHAASAEFDVFAPVVVTGTVTKVDWINPHIYIYMDVKDANGKVSNYAFETTNPGRLHAAGLSKTVLGLGQTITMWGYAAKDKTKNFAWMRKISFADGHVVEVWPAANDLSGQQ